MGKPGAQEVAISLGTRAAIVASGVGMQSLLAYSLLPAGRGAFAVCTLFASMLGVIFTPGVIEGTQHFVMARKMSVSEAAASALTICTVGTLLAAVAAWPMIQSELAFFEKAESSSFYIAVALVPLNTFGAALQGLLAGLRRFGSLAWLSVMRIAVNALFVAVLVVGLGLGVIGAVGAGCISSFVMIIGCVAELRRRERLAWRLPMLRNLKRVLRYGAGFYLARIGGGVEVRIGVLILGTLAGAAEVGIFAVASSLMMQFIVISNAVFVPLLPRATRHETGHAELIAFCTRCTIWLTCAAALIFLALSSPIVRILLTAKFLAVIPLACIIAPGIIVFSGANVLTVYFRSMNRPDICSWAVGIGIVVNAILTSVLYGLVGFVAAAYGMAAGLVCRSALLAIMFFRMTTTRSSTSWLPQRGDVVRFKTLVIPFVRMIRR